MSVTPDLAGLQDAMARKRAAMGEDITFHFRPELTYPEGTVLDPDTGKPYDPLIEPSESKTVEDVTVHASVAFRPSFREDTEETKLGDIKENEVLLILDNAEWEKVQGAISFDCKGDRYKVRKSTADGIGSDYRVLVWGEREGEA